MSDLLNDNAPIQERQIRPGEAQAVEIKAGHYLQIQTEQGKQVADFVAFRQTDTEEFLSTAATRSTNASIVPQLGMTLYSNRRTPLFEIVEDTVGRHDMLYVCCDPVRYELLGAEPGHASCRVALTEALTEYGIGYDRIPDPINWFMNVSIQQRGELEIREPLAEAGDYVLLRAIEDVVAAISACPQDFGLTNAGNPTDLVIRVYAEKPEQPHDAASVAAASVKSAPTPTPADAPQPATVVGGNRISPRPARLRDTVEATVIRVEPGIER